MATKKVTIYILTNPHIIVSKNNNMITDNSIRFIKDAKHDIENSLEIDLLIPQKATVDSQCRSRTRKPNYSIRWMMHQLIDSREIDESANKYKDRIQESNTEKLNHTRISNLPQ